MFKTTHPLFDNSYINKTFNFKITIMKNSIKNIGAIVLLLSFMFGTSSLIAQKVLPNSNFNENHEILGDDVIQSLERKILCLKKKVVKSSTEYNLVKDRFDKKAIRNAKQAMIYAEQKLDLAESKLVQFQDKSAFIPNVGDSRSQIKKDNVIDGENIYGEPVIISSQETMSEEEILVEVNNAIESVGALGPEDREVCMILLMRKFSGRVDETLMETIVKAELSKK
jgi:uncharacterized protein YqeY